MNIHETYVSLETAKLLKQAGFDWEEYLVESNPNSDNDLEWKIPLHIAQKWLREVKGLDIIVSRFLPIHEMKYSYEYEYTVIASDGVVEAADCYFEEYEEALEAGIKKCLELILEKENE